MTQQELTSYLTERGWENVRAESLFDESILDRSLSMEEWRNTLVGAYCTRNNKVAVILYLAKSLGKDIPKWEDMTLPNLSDYRDFLLRNIARNTAVTYLRCLSAVLSLYHDRLPAENFVGVMRLRKEPSQHVALTEAEVERIHNYKPRSATEHDIKRSFMIECLCGARSCDIATLSEKNIKDGWLTYVSQKTKTETSVPVHRYLTSYLNDIPHRDTYRRNVMGKVIKRICKNCGITEEVKIFTKGKWMTKAKWEFVGTHTARRSFATQLALRGVPIATISKLMGHSNTQMTSRYICIEKKDIGDAAMNFFN